MTSTPTHKIDPYHADRVQKLAHIQRTFSCVVRVGDVIEFGMRGDPLFPAEYHEKRPTGKVLRVKGVGTDGASIRVKLLNGVLVDVMPYNLDPRRVWEFTDEHYPTVLRRNQALRTDVAAEAVNSSAKNVVDRSEYETLVAKVAELATMLDHERDRTQSCTTAMLHTISNVAGEVSKQSGTQAPFCDEVSRAYQQKTANLAPGMPSPFDSDFSDSDAD